MHFTKTYPKQGGLLHDHKGGNNEVDQGNPGKCSNINPKGGL